VAIKVKLADADVGRLHRQSRPQHRGDQDAREGRVAARGSGLDRPRQSFADSYTSLSEGFGRRRARMIRVGQVAGRMA